MGFSLGETLCVFGLLGALTSLALGGVPAILAQVTQTEALQLSSSGRLYWMERWANDGRAVTATAPDYVYDSEGKYSQVMPDDAGDGTITVLFKDTNPLLEDEALTIRPAFSDRVAPWSIAWICGAAEPPPGFTAVGDDRTTLPNARLVSGCRKRP